MGLVATASVVLCLYLMLNLVGETWLRFGVWMLIGIVVYFAYGRSHSRLGRGELAGTAPAAPHRAPEAGRGTGID